MRKEDFGFVEFVLCEMASSLEPIGNNGKSLVA
jgi:hypothetical protein